MQEILKLGSVKWNNEDIKKMIPEFLDIYKRKPISNNQGGMKAPHMFATWYMLKKLAPKYVIESGIWKGQGTWLIEQALPGAKVFSIDPRLKTRNYISDKVTYFKRDFSDIDWSEIKDKQQAVLFFDDHQNALNRIRQGQKLGFKHFIFEDNYPAGQGDCYSLKKAFQHAGFNPPISRKGFLNSIKKLLKPSPTVFIESGSKDADYLKEVLEVYYEFPPVIKKEKTRWGDLWNEENYSTPAPLYEQLSDPNLKMFDDEATFYTWICYARLK